MFGDDYLNEMMKSMQNPVRDARWYLDEISGVRLAERLARETLDAKAAFDRQFDPMRDACRALPDSYTDLVDRQRQPFLNAAAAVSAVSGRAAACGYDAMLSHACIPCDIAASIGAAQLDWAATAAATLSNGRLMHLDKSLDAIQAQLAADPLDAMKQHLQQISEAATALPTVETLSASLYQQFGSALTASALQQELGLHAWDEPVSDYQRAFHALADLAAHAMGYAALDDEEEKTAEAETEHETPAFDGKDSDAGQIDVYDLALRFAMPAYEIHVRLSRLASRIDHNAVGGTAEWEPMFLAVAAAHPNQAADLTRIAFLLMQRLTWPNAILGSTAYQTRERLSIEDADEFEALADDLLRVLRRIQDSMSK